MNMRFVAFLSALDNLCREHCVTLVTVQNGESHEMAAIPIKQGEDPDLVVLNLMGDE